MLYDDRDRIGVRNVVVAVTAVAWVFLIWTTGATDTHAHASGANVILAAVNWLLMLAATMAPVLIQPIRFLRGHGLARRRTRATLLFVAGYSSIWTVAGAVMLSIAAIVHSAQWTPIIPAVAVLTVAAFWQCSPAKQICLNQCHLGPAPPAFGRSADIDVIASGATHGGWCVGSCAALMLVPLFLPRGHLAAMLATAVLIFCERLDKPVPPAWRWRGLGTAWRIVAGRVRMQQGGGGRAAQSVIEFR